MIIVLLAIINYIILVISLSMIYQLDIFELKYNYTKFYILIYN